ncbi:hypothetical protein M885DRAFT_572260 [Pelagophyceae sp. CCMP2097]|nr:hypothetical protein M885DRAFT_572260 [Pelagophyceae sp. CCMP2097]
MGKASSWHEEEGYALMVAGLEVSAMETMKIDKLHDELEKAYVRHLGFVTEGKASDYDVRDGAALWTKMQEIKHDLGNVWRPLYNRVLPGGKLPSGTQLDDFKERFCSELWLAFEKGKELIKIKAAHAENAKHVGARVALQQPGVEGGMVGWHFGNIALTGTTKNKAVIKWDSNPEGLLPKFVLQTVVLQLIKDAETHKEYDDGDAMRPAKRRSVVLEGPPKGWRPWGYRFWDGFGPWAKEPSALFFGAPLSRGVPEGGLKTVKPAAATTRVLQRALKINDADLQRDEKKARFLDMGAQTMAIRVEMAFNNAIAERKNLVDELKVLWGISNDEDKAELKARLFAISKEPMPTRESVAVALESPAPPVAPVAPAAEEVDGPAED